MTKPESSAEELIPLAEQTLLAHHAYGVEHLQLMSVPIEAVPLCHYLRADAHALQPVGRPSTLPLVKVIPFSARLWQIFLDSLSSTRGRGTSAPSRPSPSRLQSTAQEGNSPTAATPGTLVRSCFHPSAERDPVAVCTGRGHTRQHLQ